MNTINYKFSPGDKVFGVNFYPIGARMVGGADAAPSFLGKVVETVSKVNSLKDNIPGVGGLLGMLGSFDQKHTTDTQAETPENK